MGLARLLGATGKLDEAFARLEGLRGNNAKAIQPRLALTNAYLRRGKNAKALKAAKEASQLAPQAPKEMLVLGQALAANGENQRSLNVFEDLARQQTNSSDAQYQLGLAHARAGSAKDATNSLENAIKLKPDHFGARVALGNLQVRTGKLEHAIKTAAALEKDYPKNAAVKTLLGDALLTSGKAKQGDATYAQAFELAPGSALLLKRYAALGRAKQPKAARKLLDDWLERNPEDAAVRLTLASRSHQQGKKSTAITEYEKVLERSPNSVMALNNLAWMYFEKGDERAISYAERAYKIAPRRTEIMDTLGWLLVHSGQTEKGLTLLERAVKAAPRLPEIQYHLAAALAKAGDVSRAIGLLDKILSGEQKFGSRRNAKLLLDSL